MSRTRSSSSRATRCCRARSSSRASGRFQATAVGDDAYARKLAAEARRFTVTHSELVAGINQILKYVTWVLVVVGPLLFLRQLQDENVSNAVSGAVAGVVGMVPEGLVLLTSIAFGLAAVTLARRKVLVQELPAVEGLARVDVVCLDKTGTLTEGIVEFERIELLESDVDEERSRPQLGVISHDEGGNATQDAIAGAFPAPAGWSAGRARAVLVRPEVERGELRRPRRLGARRAGDGVARRVRPGPAPRRRARRDRQPGPAPRSVRRARGRGPSGRARAAVALVLLQEKVRPDAAETLAYFHDQGVSLKVISGDNPRTVGAVARPGRPAGRG